MSKTSVITTGSRTFTLSNIGPLTTPFTPPVGCLPSRSAIDSAFVPGGAPRPECFPAGFKTGYSQLGYYSPGICPVSYEQATTLGEWWLGPGETGAYCCPSGFRVTGDAGSGSCSTSLATPLSKTYVLGTETTVATYLTLWEPPIPIIWREQDGFTAAPPRATDPDDPASTDTASKASGSSSKTTTIVIATVVPIAVIVAFFLWLIVHRRRCRRPDPATIITSIPELEGKEFWPVELPTPLHQGIELPALAVLPDVELVANSIYRAPPAVVPSRPVEDEEIAWLRRERERVNLRRDRLLEVQALEDEDRQLERSIRERTRAAAAGGGV